MEDKKDTIKDINLKGQSHTGQGSFSLNQKDNYSNNDYLSESVNQISLSFLNRTNKIVTALFLVTDCINEDEVIRQKLRTLGIDLISFGHIFSNKGSRDAKVVSDIINNINLSVSLLELSHSVGFISLMNFSILKKEFLSVRSVFEKHEFALDAEYPSNVSLYENRIKNLFEQKEASAVFENRDASVNQKDIEINKVSDMSHGHFEAPQIAYPEKKQYFEKIEKPNRQEKEKTHPIAKKVLSDKFENLPKISKPNNPIKSSKDDSRKTTIIKIITNKKQVAIKDIVDEISDVSEKTIQRELTSLVASGVLKKTGEKRWSRYSLA